MANVGPSARSLAIAGLIGLGVFALLWIGYLVRFGPELHLDAAVIEGLSELSVKGSGSVSVFSLISALLGPTTFRIIAVVLIALILLKRGSLQSALFLITGVLMGGIVLQLAKVVTDRPRPAGAVVAAFSSSFPSGHAFDITVGTLSLVILARPWLNRQLQSICVLIAVLVIALVCFARLALDVHHLSDVLAGCGLGLAWMVAALWIAERLALILHPRMGRIRLKRDTRPEI